MNEFLSTLLQAVLIAAIPVISAFIGKGVKAFANHLSAQTDNELAKKYLKEAADAIEEAVAFTNQTYVDTLKKSGTFTEENQEEARKKSLDKALQSNDVTKIASLGEEFDPTKHQAVKSVPVEEGQTPETIVQVLQEGYMLKDRVLRPAMVVVAQ